MNEFDKDNFIWFTTASKKELEQWYEEADISDIHYMIGLVTEQITDLRMEELALNEKNSNYYAQQTKELLNKFTLKGKNNGS